MSPLRPHTTKSRLSSHQSPSSGADSLIAPQRRSLADEQPRSLADELADTGNGDRRSRHFDESSIMVDEDMSMFFTGGAHVDVASQTEVS